MIFSRGSDNHGVSVNCFLPLSVQPGVTTSTEPMVAPVGAVALNSDAEATAKVAAVPLKVTVVAPVRLLPGILITAPTALEVVCVSTNAPNPPNKCDIRHGSRRESRTPPPSPASGHRQLCSIRRGR